MIPEHRVQSDDESLHLRTPHSNSFFGQRASWLKLQRPKLFTRWLINCYLDDRPARRGQDLFAALSDEIFVVSFREKPADPPREARRQWPARRAACQPRSRSVASRIRRARVSGFLAWLIRATYSR
jgi:hypothetical protein